ncbi:MAG: exopolysaccharide biosynthesis polyprenyl glycosylphosphotransferase [Bacteroidetes bacterium]|jgi:Undecaprenyl-phosphate glucose phosphotransferase|nr:exopolysaccharide biosynthesis polyprenyl glycosylphosphotransferase [Bacteroidota bacterium]
MRKTGQKLTIILLLFDVLALNSSICLTILLKNSSFTLTETNELIFLIYNTIFIITVLLYDKNVILKRRYAYQRIVFQFKSSLLLLAMISVVILMFKLTHLSRLILFGTAVIFLVIRVIMGTILYKSLAILRKKGRALRKLVVLGSNGISEHIQNYCNQHQYMGYNVVAIIPVDLDDVRRITNKTALLRKLTIALDGQQVDELIINIPMSEDDILNEVIRIADKYGKRVRLVPDYYRVLRESYKTGIFADMPVINIREIPLDNIIQSSIKRIFDFVFSGFVIIILSPIYLILAILIKLSSRGPILYNPMRVGLYGKTFKMYKYRSMYVDESQDVDSKSTIADDPRITPLGEKLRKYSLDELPQFLNVFLGQMSVVGPRPHRIWLNEKLKREVNNYMVRHYLRPGISGWAQVNGWRGPTMTEEEKTERTKHDIWYLENWSFLLDIKIIYLTIFGKKANHKAF